MRHESALYDFCDILFSSPPAYRYTVKSSVVEDFKRMDLAKYKVRSSNEVQTLLDYLVISLIFTYLHV